MKKVLLATWALRDRQIVVIEWLYTENTFFMKSAVHLRVQFYDQCYSAKRQPPPPPHSGLNGVFFKVHEPKSPKSIIFYIFFRFKGQCESIEIKIKVVVFG